MKMVYTILVVAFLGCSPKGKTASADKKGPEQPAPIEQGRDQASKGYKKAWITDMTGLDACTFLLKLEDGSRLQPDQLAMEFRKDGLAVWIKYGLWKDAMSTCMSGKMVRLTAIEVREE